MSTDETRPRALDHATDVLSDIADTVNSTVDETADSIADQSHRLGTRMRSAAHRTSSALSDRVDQMRDMDPRTLVNDATALSKRYPGITLAAALTLGFFAGRALTRKRM